MIPSRRAGHLHINAVALTTLSCLLHGAILVTATSSNAILLRRDWVKKSILADVGQTPKVPTPTPAFSASDANRVFIVWLQHQCAGLTDSGGMVGRMDHINNLAANILERGPPRDMLLGGMTFIGDYFQAHKNNLAKEKQNLPNIQRWLEDVARRHATPKGAASEYVRHYDNHAVFDCVLRLNAAIKFLQSSKEKLKDEACKFMGSSLLKLRDGISQAHKEMRNERNWPDADEVVEEANRFLNQTQNQVFAEEADVQSTGQGVATDLTVFQRNYAGLKATLELFRRVEELADKNNIDEKCHENVVHRQPQPVHSKLTILSQPVLP
jgi:hypothetical protein